MLTKLMTKLLTWFYICKNQAYQDSAIYSQNKYMGMLQNQGTKGLSGLNIFPTFIYDPREKK